MYVFRSKVLDEHSSTPVTSRVAAVDAVHAFVADQVNMKMILISIKLIHS